MSDPPISVVMTAYNGRAYIGEAIASVLAQSWEDFELVVVDDASTDDTLEIVRGFADRRIRVLANERNLGISNSRNKGEAAARGRYIAAHDQDDLSAPHRLARHMDVMEGAPDVVLATGHVLDMPRTWHELDPIPEGEALAWRLFTGSPITHSAICLRKGVFGEGVPFYRQEYHYAEDFELYHRLTEVGRIVVLPEVLGTYRYHAANTSSIRAVEMFENTRRFLLGRYRDYLGAEFVGPEDMASILDLCVRSAPALDFAQLDRVGTILDALVAAFLARRRVSEADCEAVYAEAARIWWRIVRAAAARLGPRALDRYGAFANLGRRPVKLADRLKAHARSTRPVRALRRHLAPRRGGQAPEAG